MAAMPKNLESSLPVPSVQELVVSGLKSVPSSYIRDDVRDTIYAVPQDHELRVPLIDMAKLVSLESRGAELQKLHLACTDWGIFQLINHEVPTELLESMGEQSRGFFGLPVEEKKRCAQKPGSLEGYGQAFVTSEEQKLDWNDMLFLKALPVQNRNLQFWPETPGKFRETFESYADSMRRVAISTMSFMATALQIDGQQLCEAYQNGFYDIRLNCYPPCPEPEQVIGLSPHADNSGITLLVDYGNTPGLQVQKDGRWVFVEPIDDAIVVFVGQITEVLSNGIYKAADHRAVVNRSKERHSLVTFCYPDSSVKFGPAKELVASGNEPKYKTLTREEYFHCFFNRKLEVPFIDSFVLEVAQTASGIQF